MSAILILTFVGANGSDVIFSFPYFDTNTTTTRIKALVDGLITNGSIFENPPVQLKTTRFVEFQDYDIEATS